MTDVEKAIDKLMVEVLRDGLAGEAEASGETRDARHAVETAFRALQLRITAASGILEAFTRDDDADAVDAACEALDWLKPGWADTDEGDEENADAPGRTKQDVLDAFDRAIELAKAEGDQ